MLNGDSISNFVIVLKDEKAKTPHSHKINENVNGNFVIAIAQFFELLLR